MDNQYFQCFSVRDRFVSFQQKCTENKQKKCFLCYEKENVFTKGKARMRFAQRMRLHPMKRKMCLLRVKHACASRRECGFTQKGKRKSLFWRNICTSNKNNICTLSCFVYKIEWVRKKAWFWPKTAKFFFFYGLIFMQKQYNE